MAAAMPRFTPMLPAWTLYQNVRALRPLVV